MTDENSLRMFETLLRLIPGVESAHVFRTDQGKSVGGRVRCETIKACDMLAYCAMASNYPVTIREIDCRLCCEGDNLKGLPCDLRFPDNSNEIPTATQMFGFFLAKRLYMCEVLNHAMLDDLERDWNCSFSTIRG